MSDAPTVPIFDPQGTLRDVPYDQMKAAVAAGGKPAVAFDYPGRGSNPPRMVPADRVQEAVANGGKMLPIQEQEAARAGFWSNLTSDLGGYITGIPDAVRQAGRAAFVPGAAGPETVAPALAQDQARKQAGYSPLYRGAAVAAQTLPTGVNVPGMEQSAAEGDIAGVAGHAAAPVAAAAIVRGAQELKAALPAGAKPIATAPVRLAARTAETAINQKLVPVRPIMNIMTPADEASGTQFKVPGRDYGLQKPVAQTAPNAQPTPAEATAKPADAQASLAAQSPASPNAPSQAAPVESEAAGTAVNDAGKFAKAKPNPPYTGPRVPSAMAPVESGNVGKIGFHEPSNTMMIEYKNGDVYEYRGVPKKIFDNVADADSIGSFVSRNIKGRYETNYRGNILGKSARGAAKNARATAQASALAQSLSQARQGIAEEE